MLHCLVLSSSLLLCVQINTHALLDLAVLFAQCPMTWEGKKKKKRTNYNSVPWGSPVNQFLFIACMHSLGNIIRPHNLQFHYYAINTERYNIRILTFLINYPLPLWLIPLLLANRFKNSKSEGHDCILIYYSWLPVHSYTDYKSWHPFRCLTVIFILRTSSPTDTTLYLRHLVICYLQTVTLSNGGTCSKYKRWMLVLPHAQIWHTSTSHLNTSTGSKVHVEAENVCEISMLISQKTNR